MRIKKEKIEQKPADDSITKRIITLRIFIGHLQRVLLSKSIIRKSKKATDLKVYRKHFGNR